MAPLLTCRLLRDAAAIESIEPHWDRLWRASGVRHVFQGPAWSRAILDAHGPAAAPCVAAVYDAERLIGLLPLRLEDGGRARALGAPYADYNDLLAEPARAAEVLAAALDALWGAGLRRAVVENVRADAVLRQAVAAARTKVAGRLTWSAGVRCPAVVLAPSAETVLAPLLAKHSLRRHEKRLARLGALRFRHVEDPGEARSLLGVFFAQHAARRAMAGDRSLFTRAEPKRFYEALVCRLGLQTVRFGVLEVGGAPAAFHFGFECDGRFTWYKPAFDVDLWDAGPGEVLLRRILEYARDRGLAEVDFTRGEEAFKSRFANVVRETFTLHVLPPGHHGALAAVRLRSRAFVGGRPALQAPPRWLVKQARRSVRALRRDGPPRLGARLARRGWRRFVRARDEVILFRFDRTRAAPEGDGLEVRRAGLSELARLAAAHPEQLDGRRLTRARRRLAAGERLFLAFADGELACVAWLGVRREISAVTEVGPEPKVPLEREGALLYDCWTPPSRRGRGFYTRTLRAVAAGSPLPDVWAFCESGNVPSRRGIVRAGFVETHRMGRVVWFGRPRRHWARPTSATGS